MCNLAYKQTSRQTNIGENSTSKQNNYILTGRHRGPKRKLRAERRHNMHLLCAVCNMFAYWTFPVNVHVIFFMVECGITRFLCAMRVLCAYSTFGHHPHRLGYPCAKFRFCHPPIAEIACKDKSCTQSLSHLAYLMCREPKLQLQNKSTCVYKATYHLIPPISKPITGCPVFALYVVSAYPTTPPAGPDNIAREPLNLPTAFNHIYHI